MDRRIKFRHLDAFSAICRQGSLKRAAEEINLTQPAISKTLKELEEILGVILLTRSRSGVSMTPEGEVFLQFAEQSSAAMRLGIHSVQNRGSGVGKLRIGALPSVASDLLAPTLNRFCADAPDIQVEILEGAHADLTAGLRRGALDVVVGRLGLPETMDGLTFHQLHTEEVVVVAAPDSPARSLRRFEDLEAFRVLYPPKASAIRPLVARHLIARGVPLFSNRIESASASFGRALTRDDPGTVWFISRGVVRRDIAEGVLVQLPLDMSDTAGAVGAMTRTQDVISPAVRRLITGLSQQVAALDATGKCAPAGQG